MSLHQYLINRTLACSILLFTLLGLLACQSPNQQEDPAQIRIGFLAPINALTTGISNPSTRNSAQLAINEVNEAGGLLVNGQAYQIVLVEGDDGGTPETAAQTALRLINQENVVAIIGPPFSSTALAVAPLANEAGIPLITPTATNPEITPNRPYIFRATFDDNFQAIALANFIHADLAYNRVAVLYDISNNYSQSLAETFTTAFSQNGGNIVAIETYTADTNINFTSQLQQIEAAQPEAIFLPNPTNDVLIQGAAIREMGLTATLIGGDSWQGQRLSAEGSFAGSFFSGNYCRDMNNETISRFVHTYEAAYDSVPDGLAALTYDSFGLLFAAIQAQNSIDTDSIKDGLYNITYDGVTGPIKFDTNGNPINKNVAIWTITESDRHCYAIISPE